jgi:hypothetical protein
LYTTVHSVDWPEVHVGVRTSAPPQHSSQHAALKASSQVKLQGQNEIVIPFNIVFGKHNATFIIGRHVWGAADLKSPELQQKETTEHELTCRNTLQSPEQPFQRL